MNNPVFQQEIDVLGVVIYSTEFALWCGVFAAGAWFNLGPWLRVRYGSRREEGGSGGTEARRGSRDSREVRDERRSLEGVMELERIPSSTSVFRTSGSLRERIMAMR